MRKTFLKTINAGLQRHAMSVCSKWAEKSRVMGAPFPGPWSFTHHPWLRDMHDSKYEICVGRKAAQMGFTECALNETLFTMDILRRDCLYLLPAKTPDATDFSAARFNPALELSPYLADLFSDVSNIGHKRAGAVNLYIRGSRSRAGLKSIPVSFIVFDEVDEMDQENVPLALERQSGQVHKKAWFISTPTVEDKRIDEWFKRSTQKHFFFPCPHCGRSIELTYPKCLKIVTDDPNDPAIKNSYLMCPECEHALDHTHKSEFLSGGIWVPEQPTYDIDGFTINQMYSPTLTPGELARYVLLAPLSPAKEQEFFNSKLGLPHTVAGAKISLKEIEACKGGYQMCAPSGDKVVTVGIDVGTYLNYAVAEWTITPSPDINMGARSKLLEAGTVRNFEDLHAIMAQHKPNYTVIDANPERRKSFEFAQKYWGAVSMCFYGNSSNGKQITKTKDRDGTELELAVTVDRTSWLDLTLGRFKNQKITIPTDLPRDFSDHISALVRRYKENRSGISVGTYENYGPDHYAHALTYAEIALNMLGGIGSVENTESPR